MAKKLLVVDSNLAVQKLVEYNLSREKFEVTCLNDGLSALDLLTKIDPDLILADYHLEGISFSRFCEKIKQKQSEKERPILVLVAPSDSYDPNKLLALGVVDFVKKPLEPNELIEKLKDLSQEAATMVDTAPRPPAEPSTLNIPTESSSELPQPTLKEQAEIMKIEELLGWSVAGVNPIEESASNPEPVSPETDYEMTVVESRAKPDPPSVGVPVEKSEEPPAPLPAAAKMTIEENEQTIIESQIPSPSAHSPEPVETPAPSSEPPHTPVTPGMLEAAFPQLYTAPEAVEPPPSGDSKLDPAPVEPQGQVSPEMVQDVVSKMAKEIIEKVAWDVVPSLAEHLIREELEKLKPEKLS